MAMSPNVRQARAILADVSRELGPPSLPVRFRASLPEDGPDYGQVWRVDRQRATGRLLKRPYFLVLLDKGMCEGMNRDTVVHELAHIYAWEAEGVKWRDNHDALWGVTYAKVYCAAFGVA